MLSAVILFLASALVVDWIGYWLHRWAHRPGSPLYRPHMTHHVTNYPPKRFFSDKYRSSGADGLAIWFAPFGIVYIVLVLLSGLPALPILLGGGTMALGSALFHDLTHISDSVVWRVPGMRQMSFWHRVHHSKMGRNFGILSPLWDRLHGTNWTVRRQS